MERKVISPYIESSLPDILDILQTKKFSKLSYDKILAAIYQEEEI